MNNIDDLIAQIEELHPQMQLPFSMSSYFSWLERRQGDSQNMLPVSNFANFKFEGWMVDQDIPLLWAASWYARRKSKTVKKVSVSNHKNNEADFVVFKNEFFVTRHTTTSGQGPQSVYVYGFDNDQGYLKIGLAGQASSVSGVYLRVMQQVSTSNRTLPKLHHVFFTEDCLALENRFHQHFKFQGRWAYSGAGTEWFKVSLDEVLNAYEGQ